MKALLSNLVPAVLLLSFACNRNDDPGETEVPIDVTAALVLNQPKVLELGVETHTFTVLQTMPERTIIKIQSEPQVAAYFPGEPQEVNVNGEGGPDIRVEVTAIDGDNVTVHITNISTSGSASGGAPPPDPWTLPVSPVPSGTLLYTLTLVADTEGPTELYAMAPQKDACDQSDPKLFDAYVAETGNKTRIIHQVGSSPGFPYFSIMTEEKRSRFADCLDQWGHGKVTDTELMIDEKRPVDLDGNGSPDVDAVLHQVQFNNGKPTLKVLIFERG